MTRYISVFLVLITIPLTAQTTVNRSFYADGKVESEISFINDVLDGTSYWFYENGNLKKEANYSSGILNGWIREYFVNGIVASEIKVNMGVKDGLSKYYYDNGGLKETRTFDNGKLLSIRKVSFDPGYVAPKTRYFTEISGVQNGLKRKEEYLCPIEICPEPAGGIETVLSNLVYPDDAKKYGLEGIVSLVASVDEKGIVKNTKVIKGIELGCDEAAELAVKKTQFIPGQDKGEVVAADVVVYVPFRLNQNNDVASTAKKVRNTIPAKTLSAKTENKIKIKIEDINCDTDECAYPVGGMEAIISNIYLNPEYDLTGYSGSLTFMVKVDETGKVAYTKIIGGISKKLDENIEAGIINTRFNPGIKNGKPAVSVMNLKLNISR